MKINPTESRNKGKKFYISDLHLGHGAIIKIDKRPFSTYEEMYDTIVRNWNNTVSDEDTIYILGDFSFKTSIALDIVKKLKGHKVLILGNHDCLNEELKKHFDVITDYYEMTDKLNHNSVRVILSHYPIAHWNHQFHNAVHVYGHVHNNKDYKLFREYIKNLNKELNIDAKAYNCGCMLPYMQYTPRTLQELYELVGLDDIPSI